VDLMFTVDGREVISFSRQLQEVPKELRSELRKRIRSAADVIKTAAQSNASWSSRIPGAISVRTGFGRGSAVRVVVSAKRAPHARAFEGITQDGRGTFRHPVFGRDVWVEQPTRPFLQPAVRQHQDRVVRDVQDAIDHVLGDL
jgi:hypothetical protein